MRPAHLKKLGTQEFPQAVAIVYAQTVPNEYTFKSLKYLAIYEFWKEIFFTVKDKFTYLSKAFTPSQANSGEFSVEFSVSSFEKLETP